MYEAPLRTGFSAAKYSKMLEHAYEDMEWLRVATSTAIEEYKGRRRSRQGSIHRNPRPINALNQLVATYLPYISAYKIIPKIKSRGSASRAEAEFREYLTTAQLEAMEFAEVDRQIGLDAILSSFGAGKLINCMGAGRFKSEDTAADWGEIIFRRTPPEDIIFDPNATSIRSCSVIFDRYTANKDRLIESLMQHGLNDKAELIKKLTPLDDQPEMLTPRGMGGTYRDETSPTDDIVLWDAAIFDGNELYIGTMAHWDDGDHDQWIVEPEIYEGGERGPHMIVSLLDVPGEPIGMSVADQMMELHYSLQKIGEKAVKQILKTKRVNAYKASQRQDADAIRKADDDEFVGVANPELINEVVTGGLLAEMGPGIEMMFGLLNKATMNVDFAGGRGGGGGTATEQALRDQRVNKGFGDMRERIQKMRRTAIKRMNMWIDDVPALEAKRTVPGAFNPMELTYSNATRRSPYSGFEYDCSVVTADTLDPAMRIAKLAQAAEMLERLMTLAMKFQGDVSVVPDIVASEFEVDDIRRIFPTRNGMMLDDAARSMNPGMQSDGERMGMGGSPVMRSAGNRAANTMSGQPSITTQSDTKRRPIDNTRASLSPTVPQGGAY